MRADRTGGCHAHMSNDNVSPRGNHRNGFVRVEDVRTCQQVKGVSLMDHIHLKTEAHSCLFKNLSHDSVVKSDGRKILNATETKVLQLSKEHRHDAERIGAADSGQYR